MTEPCQLLASDRVPEPSAYLNMRATASYVSQASSGGTGFDVTTVDMDGAVRLRGVVLEGEASIYAGSPAGLTQAVYQDFVFYRHGTRLVYDIPEDAMRIRAGDITPDYTGFQTAPDLLGLSVQQTYAQLQPQKNIHPTGSHSFRIERPSEVDIIVDGVLFRHIRLAPSNYDLSELPLRPGANKVESHDCGRFRSAADLGVYRFYRRRAARPGISEWSLNAGIKSYDQGVIDQADAAGGTLPLSRAQAAPCRVCAQARRCTGSF